MTELAQLSGFSKSYISQVKNGKCPASQKLLDAIACTLRPEKDYLALFIKSRQAMGVSPRTLEFYRDRLSKFIQAVDYIKTTRAEIHRYLNSIPPNHNGLATRHASFRAIKTFYRWLNIEYRLPNPIVGMSAPILGKPILPSLSASEVHYLIEQTENTRDKAIIALFTESGLRLSELVNIKTCDIDWLNHTIKESLVKVEKRLMLHLVSYQSDISGIGLMNINLKEIFGASQKIVFRPC